jgi:3-keto-disaccharide hydrolase
MSHGRMAGVLILTITCGAGAQERVAGQPPPKGFTSVFNGKDLSGWRGRQPNYNPADEARLTREARAEKQVQWNAERDQHWRVDGARKEIVSDGKSPHLATEKDYGDFEFHADWLMVSPNGDSGVYLRGVPQVQVWDPDNPREVKNGAPKGSGALWNNNPDNPGKWPLVKADNPVGQWNTFKIRMVGTRVWIWLNDKLTVDGQVLDNFFDRSQPVPSIGPIELQTHGSEIRFRNVYVREIPASEAKAILDTRQGTTKN